MTVQIIVFLCAIGLAPADCTRATAIDVMPLGEAASDEGCMMQAQVMLAGLALRADDEYRWIVKCQRTSIGKDTIG